MDKNKHESFRIFQTGAPWKDEKWSSANESDMFFVSKLPHGKNPASRDQLNLRGQTDFRGWKGPFAQISHMMD